MKRIGKVVIFLLSIVCSFLFLTSLFQPKNIYQPWDTTKKIRGFYAEPKNTLDVVFVGSSHMFMGVNPMEIWKTQGIPSYIFGANEQPLWISYHYIKEIFKTQKPKVIVLDVLYAHRYSEYEREGVNQINLMDLKLSSNKFKAIKISVPPKERKKYYLPFYAYHDRWKAISEIDFKYIFSDKKNFLKGFTFGTANPIFKVTFNEEIGESKKRPPKIEKYLKKIIDLTKENKTELLLIKTPSPGGVKNVEEIKSFNRVAEIAKENKVEFLNLNKKVFLEKMGFDFSEDMNDGGHLNYKGAKKVSDYLGNYLKENYKLKDKKENPTYKEWKKHEKLYDSEFAKVELKTKTNLVSYLENIKKVKDIAIIFSVSDEAANQYEKYNTILKTMNLNLDLKQKFRWSYIGIVNSNGKNYLEKLEDKKLEERLHIGKNLIEVISAGFNSGNYATIKINGKEYSKNKRGFNIVVYDYKKNQVLDSINVDAYGDPELKINR
jgi:hypothetical protein